MNGAETRNGRPLRSGREPDNRNSGQNAPRGAPQRAALQLFAPCPRGLEPALAEELAALGARDCRITGGGVAFTGDASVAMLANLHSRIASRILMQIIAGRCRDEDALYRLARRVEWEHWFNERVTMRVDVSAQRSPLRSLNFATLRVKDAICDRFRDLTGVRPSINTRAPDVRVFAFLEAIDATLYLDLSGEALFKRGWRSAEDSAGAAPLKENLAAGLLALAGWQPGRPLLDPMCGSGTLLIEAAQRALGIAPGTGRSFGFERLTGFEPLEFANLRQAAEQAAQAARLQLAQNGGALPISGSDIDPRAVDRTNRNLLLAGIPAGAVSVAVADFGALRPAPASLPAPGIIVTNPPYGARLHARLHGGDDLPDDDAPGYRPSGVRPAEAQPAPPSDDDDHQRAMQAIGATLRRDFGGWRACLLSPDPELPRQLGMQPARRTPLFNGAIECRLFCFDIFDRSQRSATHPANQPTT